MNNNIKRASFALLSIGFFAMTAVAAEKEVKGGVSFSGNFEGGYATTWQSTPSASTSKFMVDQVNVDMKANVSNRTSVVFNNAFTVQPNTSKDTGGTLDFFSAANNFTNGITGTNFGMYNTAAYLDHKCMDGWHTWVGNFKTPFGMETMWNQYDLPTYYYSAGYSAINTPAKGHFDLGVKFAISEMIPGTLEVALIDSRTIDRFAPGQALRYSYDYKSGDMSFMPVFSAYLARWAGGPKDMGFNVGFQWKSGMFLTNAEWNYFTRQLSPDAEPKSKVMNVYVEPGIDFGVAMLSAKVEWVNSNVVGANTWTSTTSATTVDTVSDWNVAAALTKQFEGNYRIRLTYAHAGLSGNLVNHTNDVRLLFGTKF